ncbi:MAG: hypothetical protein HYZ89_00015 [Candidatus Omnitrophica bacterium]|nr:hypothetical protein [Candidatus Omnitrophota bacterium]
MPTIISTNIRVRHPEHFVIGEGSVIDDFSYFSTRVRVGRYSHIASGCSIAGGGDRTFTLGDYSSLSSGVKIWCTSDDFVHDVVALLPAEWGAMKEHLITGDVCCENLTAVGANAVVMPRNHLPEGTAIGALSFVPPDFPFKPWSVYAGTPIRFVKPRDRESVLRQVDKIAQHLKRLAHA